MPLMEPVAPTGRPELSGVPQRETNRLRTATIARRSRVRAGKQAGDGSSVIM